MKKNKSSDFRTVLDLLKAEQTARQNHDPQPLGPILSWSEWIESPYYSGYLSRELYPYWKKKIAQFYETGCNELVITGCIGGGKTWASNAFLAYKLYRLSRYRYPQRLFNLSSHSTLLFAYVTTTQRQAQLAGFSELKELIDSIEYFQKEFPRNKDLSSRLEWPSHNITVVGGSSAQDVLSMNLLGIVLDELNFYRKGGSGAVGNVEKAQDDYANTTHRRRSRFVYKGVDYSFSILISSATVNSSFTNKRIKEGKDNKQLKQMVVDVKQWEAKEGVDQYSKEKFAVFAGNDTTDAQLIERPEDFLSICPGDIKETARISKCLDHSDVSLEMVFKGLSSRFREKCLLIPVDFLIDFKTDLYKAVQNVAGMSVGDSGKFFTSNTLWNISCSNVPELTHPFTKEMLHITTLTGTRLEDVFLPHILFNEKTGRFLRHPNAKRYVHIDQSETGDTTGIGMCHFAGLKETDSGLNLPVIEMDFVLAIENTSKPDRIDLAKILDFLLWLRRNYQVRYGKVSYDKFASNYQIQILDKQHIPTGLVSVDKDDKPYRTFRSLLDEKRLNQYYFKLFKTEMFSLIHDRKKQKVDHPSDSSKDVADGFVGAVWSCISDIDKLDLDTTGSYKENTKFMSPYKKNTSSVLGQCDWLLADYEKKIGAKIVSIKDLQDPIEEKL